MMESRPCRGILCLFLSFYPALLLADGPTRQQEPPKAIVEKYTQLCASCHGPNLEGGLGPSLISQTSRHGNDDDSLTHSIRNGYPAQGMPAWGEALSEGDIRSLVIYIREKRSGPRPIADIIRIPA